MKKNFVLKINDGLSLIAANDFCSITGIRLRDVTRRFYGYLSRVPCPAEPARPASVPITGTLIVTDK